MKSPGFYQQVDPAANFQFEDSDGCRRNAYLEIDAAEYDELGFIHVAEDVFDDSLQHVSGAGLCEVFPRNNDVFGTNPDCGLGSKSKTVVRDFKPA